MPAVYSTRKEPGQVTELPAVFSLDARSLVRMRERALAGDAALRPALEALRRNADAALQEGPYSVMHKRALPPSGDRHDYVSYGPYWWPDPDKPDGLPYVRRDGERNPEFLDDTRSDSPRLKALADAVSRLALASWLLPAGEPYARRAAHLLRVWFVDPATRMNAHLEFGQAIPGRVAGRGIGIIDTSRLAGTVDDVGLLAQTPAWSAADQSALQHWFAEYLDWLIDSSHGHDERGALNNHGTWYDAQVVSFSLFTGRGDLARRTIATDTRARIDAQIEPDGRQPAELARTKAFDYSVFNLNAYVALAAMGTSLGEDLWGYTSPLGGSIRKAIDWLSSWTDDALPWTYTQIEPLDRGRLLPLLLQAARATGDARYAAAIARLDAQRAAEQCANLLYPIG